MNGLILSLFVCIVFLFHVSTHTAIKRGKIRESLCAIWCVDALFAICGTILSFRLYHYTFADFITLRNALWLLIYLVFIVLFFLLAPSGLLLFQKRSHPSEEELLLCEYRFNDTVELLRNYLFLLLFGLPLLFILLQDKIPFRFLYALDEAETYGGFCFAAFGVLIPVSIRQMLFWFQNLARTPLGDTDKLLKKRRQHMMYHKKNYFL